MRITEASIRKYPMIFAFMVIVVVVASGLRRPSRSLARR